MAKDKRSKKDVVFHLTPEQNTLSKMPKYNGFAIGHGAHGKKKYTRKKKHRDELTEDE